METNKLTLEDNFLSLEQAKELQELGIDFEGANAWFYRKIKDEKGNSIHYSEWRFGFSKRMMILGVEKFEYVPTLSVAEMLEMLPHCVHFNDYYCEFDLRTRYNLNNEIYYRISYSNVHGYAFYSDSEYLRDALFEMIKLLKQNKLI